MLAGMGYHVTAADRNPEVIAAVAGIEQITAQVIDLEGATWPYASVRFQGVVVTNYLYRPHFQALINLLGERGVLIYETFMTGNEALGRPTNPSFLLQPGELLERVRGQLTVVAFEQGRIERPKPAVVQRICAVAGTPGVLPDLPIIAASSATH
jgi:hypothetical protein